MIDDLSMLDMLRMSESVTVPTQTVIYLAKRVDDMKSDLRWAEQARDAAFALLIEYGHEPASISMRIGHSVSDEQIARGAERLREVSIAKMVGR